MSSGCYLLSCTSFLNIIFSYFVTSILLANKYVFITTIKKLQLSLDPTYPHSCHPVSLMPSQKNLKKVKSVFPISSDQLPFFPQQCSKFLLTLYLTALIKVTDGMHPKPKYIQLTGLFDRMQHGWSFWFWTFSSLAFWDSTLISFALTFLSPCLALSPLYQILECSEVLVSILSLLILDKLHEPQSLNILSICRWLQVSLSTWLLPWVPDLITLIVYLIGVSHKPWPKPNNWFIPLSSSYSSFSSLPCHGKWFEPSSCYFFRVNSWIILVIFLTSFKPHV